ncbi:hypothetical protein TWF506_005783 [Arthrobotrys conoides]|uniref:Uncharacterized protein n=1 Tax=Arthrobotrys conoides TaxID=74498 RepID=A0AAN8NJW6_9PEZI
MSFRQGYYTIITKVEGSECQVSRATSEDLNLDPKYIWALKPGVSELRPWLIKKTDGYIDLEVLGTHTGVTKGISERKPFAFIDDRPSEVGAIGWILEPTGDPDTYRIKTKDGRLYWQFGDRELSQGRIIELAEKSGDPRQEFKFYLHREVNFRQRLDPEWERKYGRVPEIPLTDRKQRRFRA